MTTRVLALRRLTFETSRLLEFFSEKELAMQIGHERPLWLLALIKELMDNALDGCETAGIQPVVSVEVEGDAVTVRDCGPGLPLATLERSLDYSVRVSDKANYVSPTRGQLGNALKCIWAAPFIVGGGHGRVEVATGGKLFIIDVTLDKLAQTPRLEITTEDSLVRTGTSVRMVWPDAASYLDGDAGSQLYKAGLHDLFDAYAAFNPHASFTLSDCGATAEVWASSSAGWTKWNPGEPTSPHWYDTERFSNLVAAYVVADRVSGRQRTTREFVGEFRGLTGTAKQKQVLDATGMSGMRLDRLIVDGEVDKAATDRLLNAMRAVSRPINPGAYGVLGREHLIGSLGLTGDTVKYKKVVSVDEAGMPFVLEVAFDINAKVHGERGQRRIVTGINWAPTIQVPFHQMHWLLQQARVDPQDPVTIVVHLVHPRPLFVDRGKGQLSNRGVMTSLESCITSVTASWREAKRHADREQRVRERDLERMLRGRTRELTLKDATYEAMPAAYLKASDDGRLPANARQVMYAARPMVLEMTGGNCWKDDSYFTQHLLPDYLAEHPASTGTWDIVFDARGQFKEPHQGERIGLGTLAVRQYVNAWSFDFPQQQKVVVQHRVQTRGPVSRYEFVLFIEKEGFNELIDAANVMARFDIALMSTKGMSVTAARMLVEELSAKDVTILVAHDFDKSGFSILGTLGSDTRRYSFRRKPKVIDLGLRLPDVTAMGLTPEPVSYDGKTDPRINLRQSGATTDECDFLVQPFVNRWSGQRVELNAMTSRQFIDWLESKLVLAGVQKVVPEATFLAASYRRMVHQAHIQELLDSADHDIGKDLPVPDDLAEQVGQRIKGSDEPWDDALWELVKNRNHGGPS